MNSIELSDRIVDGKRQPYWIAPRDWVGDTAVVIGTGPSLTQAQINYCRDKARVIAINDAYKLAPWADTLWGCDGKWWRWHSNTATKFAGDRITLDPMVPASLANLMNNTGREGFDDRPWCVRTGANGGYQGVCLAALRGAVKILLVGFDHRGEPGQSHFFGDHPDRLISPYDLFIRQWRTLVEPMTALGIEIINCTPGSALDVWNIEPLEDVL